ncbi:polyketide biosynthesis acyl carrier protein [Chitinophaga sp. CF118]|uniref:phosphopantetheine-binding protein n=1 Tax=Chitinophaga sp. CF118 TaxID=1884367 RepID=UPI0008E384A7|nr:phosphopantetheine-binding protein [Chitinophaga sp. CF118]SFD21672.1 polyketide biosynthesis acyl carrier protein [Chitinophaga sp. CF118]
MKEQIVKLIVGNLVEIIPELSEGSVSLDETFVDMGANSIDRAELIMLTLERLDLEVSRIEFVSAQTVNELADLIIQKQQR